MFKRSKRKIVAAIMAVLALLYLGTLAVIYGSSYIEVSASNYEMLERYAQMYSLEKQPGEDAPSGGTDFPEKNSFDTEALMDSPDNLHFDENPAFQLSTFYSVAISDSGEILAMDNETGTVYEDTVLQEYAYEIIDSQKDSGMIENLLYTVAIKDGYTLVAFMDNTIMQQSMTTLFRYTIVFGSVMLVALFFVAVYLAGRIVKPLEESHQKQKQFISDAGHELKTPISVIGTNADLLEREIGENKWLSNIQYENEKMGNLVSQLLALTRTENSDVPTEPLNFSRLVKGEALPFESVAFEKGLLLNCEIQDGLSVEGNRDQLKQLVSILLDNAICHGKNGKEISLTLKEEHGFARLSVINNGNEIPPSEREKLFERFYRGDTARNEKGGHYGLGLAIAKAIVTAHKGKIQVFCYDSRVEFAVLLPLIKNVDSSM